MPIYKCAIFGECSSEQHHVGQREKVCRFCPHHTGPVRPRWDRQVTGLYPEPKKQNFNCSLLIYQGRRLFAYRHRWTGSRVGLCELDENWQPIWNCLVKITGSRAGTAQEDPRLFVFQGQLHVAYTTFARTLANGVNVGYSALQEKAPGVWEASEVFLPHYPQRKDWEKNWSFFESDGRLWCIHDSLNHTILEIRGNEAEFAYSYSRTIPGNHGFIRGGPSPLLVGDRMLAFPHFKRAKHYSMGFYTFNPHEPFEPRERCTYPVLQADPKLNTSIHFNRNIAFPCGSAVVGSQLVISYGAYDRDCRLAGYDLTEVLAAAAPYSVPHPTADARAGHQRTFAQQFKAVPIYWWNDKQNFGDAIGPAIVSHCSGKRVCWSDHSRPRLLTCGSILTRARPGDVVWGSGVHDLTLKPVEWSPAGIQFLAVRGPITRQYILDRGGECPEIYGDPGLLLPQLLPQSLQPVRELAAMPHLGDEAGRKFCRKRGIPLIDPSWEWSRVIAEICVSARLVTSSLHGLVAAEAYGVPVTWARYTESPEKFYDYYQGCGRESTTALSWPNALRHEPPAWLQPPPAELLPALLDHFSREMPE